MHSSSPRHLVPAALASASRRDPAGTATAEPSNGLPSPAAVSFAAAMDETGHQQAERATPERWMHGVEAEIADGVQRVVSSVGALRRAGELTDADVATCERWYRDFALAVFGARDAGTGGSGDPAGAMDAVVKASEGYKLACRTLGIVGDRLMRAFVGAGLSLAAMGKATGRNQTKVAGAVVVIIQRLTEHYAEVDHARPNKRADIRSVVMDSSAIARAVGKNVAAALSGGVSRESA
jgi:hypothetical protein